MAPKRRQDEESSDEEYYTDSERNSSDNEEVQESDVEEKEVKQKKKKSEKKKTVEKKRKSLEKSKKKPKREAKKRKTKKEVTEEDDEEEPQTKKIRGDKAKRRQEPPVPKVKTQQQRCGLLSFFLLLNDYKDRVPQESWDLLQKTCFWDMIAAFRDGRINHLQIRKYESDLELILKHYKLKTKEFVFGGRRMGIEKEDVHRLFHITKDGMELDDALKEVSRKDSDIFIRKKKSEVKRTDIDEELGRQLDLLRPNPKKIASLILMYLLAVFFFSNTGYNLEWELILLCEDLDNINRVNWSEGVIDYLNVGIHKHDPDNAKYYNGCTLLVVYWFAKNAPGIIPIREKKDETPTFIRWSINHTINEIQWFLSNQYLENLMEDKESNDYMAEAEEMPSLIKWIPQGSQEIKDRNRELNESSKRDEDDEEKDEGYVALNEDDEEKDETPKKMEDDHVFQPEQPEQPVHPVEPEQPVEPQQQVHSEKAVDEQVQQQQTVDEHEVTADVNIEKINDDFFNDNLAQLVENICQSPEKDVPQTDTQIVISAQDDSKTDVVNEAEMTSEEERFLEPDEPLQAVPLRALSVKDEEAATVIMQLEQEERKRKEQQIANDAEIASCMQKANDEEEEQEAKKKTKGKKKIVEGPHSIEKRVKVNKRRAEKPKDRSFEYNTPDSISTKPLTIENVNCATSTWKSLDPSVKRHYKDWFDENKDQDKLFPYLHSTNLTNVVTKEDLKLIIGHGDVVTEALIAYTKLFRKEIEGTPQAQKVGFLCWEAVYFVLKHIHLKNEWIEAGKEGDFIGCKFEIEKLFNDGLYSVFGKEKILIPMHYQKHHHYSLFIIDNVERKFYHMNPMRPTNKEIQDHWSMRDAMAVVDKVREFIRYINLNEVLPDSQDTEDSREAAVRMSQGDVVEEKRPMTEEEKEFKKFIVENKITGELYKLISIGRCPQQDKLSVDCAPFVLHYMEEIAKGREPTKDCGNKMRKKMLETFMKVKLENQGKLED